VASCLPLGSDGKFFLVGVALYNQENVWGITDPPKDWNTAASTAAAPASGVSAKSETNNKKEWPYNLFSDRGQDHRGRE
jgi:hypothetical protein